MTQPYHPVGLTSLLILSVADGLSPINSPILPRFLQKNTKLIVGGTSTVPVNQPLTAQSRNVTLTHYMQLPVEQYVLIPMPLGSSLKKIRNNLNNYNNNSIEGKDYNNRPFLDTIVNDRPEDASEWITTISSSSPSSATEEFELIVPNITFSHLHLQPVVHAMVHPKTDKVVITSHKCILRGSKFIENVRLNERFDFHVRTTLTWNDSISHPEPNLDETAMQCRETVSSQQPRIPSIQSIKKNEHTLSSIILAETVIDVDIDVPQPFRSIPQPILLKMGKVAITLSMNYIVKHFLESLANDYRKWANDEEYRQARAALSQTNSETLH